ATAKDGSGVKASCKITVRQPVTKITLSKTSASILKGKTVTLKATAAPASANNKAVTWTTSNKKVATVTSKGVVKGIAKGTATITAMAKDGSRVKATCKITVKQPVTSLKINETKLTVKAGKTAALKVTVAPSNANNKSLRWTSSNQKIATVTQNGVVKGVRRGTATITAAAKDGSGKKVTCKVTVQ
ncbi:MAG: Ig domain-containing protein, partial [Lachnospiraceae bacterium]|nr:Ig domain-containing protein [Lachnospiraceae bacterium]